MGREAESLALTTDPEPSFVSTPDNPAPVGLAVSFLPVGAGHRLRCALAPGEGDGPVRGTVLLLQGRNEAIEKYFETMRDLNRRGFAVATFDWRGQGRSGRLASLASVGHVPSMRVFLEDLDEVLRAFVLARCPGPYAILAHSMGALVALEATDRLAGSVERMVLTTPLVALPGSPGTHRLMRVAAGLLHWTGLGTLPVRRARTAGRGTTLADNPLTTDRRRFERNRAIEAAAPDLLVRALSASWLRAMLRAMERIDRSDVVAAMRLPTLIVTAGTDRIVSSPAAARLAWRMRSGHHIDVPGARHELLQEADRFREPVLAAFESFVGSSLPVRSAEPLPAEVAAVEDALTEL